LKQSVSGFVRIIAGKWRGRRLPVPLATELRPTPDRIRVTLFNWLAPYLSGAVCLDAFAGTGVLGIEALSRGAQSVIFIEADKSVHTQLAKTLVALESASNVIFGKFPEALNIKQAFNIVFLDPPFRQNFIIPALTALVEKSLLASGALIYIETEKEFSLSLPEGFELLKQKTAGDVTYTLVKYSGYEHETHVPTCE
jgi:16S rRNA (guanine966-N2)-methyltransferase